MNLLLRLRLFLWRFRHPTFRAGDVVYNICGADLDVPDCWRTCGRATLAVYIGPYIGHTSEPGVNAPDKQRHVICELWLTAEGATVAAGYFWRLPPGLVRGSMTTITA